MISKRVQQFVRSLRHPRYPRRFYTRVLWGVLFVVGVVLFLQGVRVHRHVPGVVAPEEAEALAQRFHAVLAERMLRVRALAELCCDTIQKATPSDGFVYYRQYIIPELRDQRLEFLIAKEDSIRIWTYRYGPSDWQRLKDLHKGYIWLYGLWYYAEMYAYAGYQIAALVPIRSDYVVQNRYLESLWDPSLAFLYGKQVPALVAESGAIFENSEFLSKNWSDNRLFFGFLLLFLLGLGTPLLFRSHKWFWSVLGTAFALTLLLLCKTQAWFVGELGDFFNSNLFALSSWIASFGDLFLYALATLGIFLQLRYLTPSSEGSTVSQISIVWSVVWLLATLFVLQALSSLSHLLLLNATITLTPYSFADMSVYALSAFVSLAFFATCLMMGTILAARQLNALPLWAKLALWLSILSLNVVILRGIYDLQAFLCNISFGLPVLLLVLIIHVWRDKPLFTGFYTLLAILNAFVICYVLDHTAQEKDIAVRSYIAEAIGNEHDQTLEYLFVDLSQQIQRDTTLRAIVNAPEPDLTELNQYFQKRFYRDYLFEYDYQLTFCYPDTEILFTQSKQQKNCQDFFSHMLYDYGHHLDGTNFYYLSNKNGRISYLGIFNFGTSSDRLSTLYVELDSKLPNYFWGYPELLIDKKYVRTTPMLNVSTALYQNNRLTSQSGEYHYPVFLKPDYLVLHDLKMVEHNGYSHMAKQLNDRTFALISKPTLNFLERAGGITYLGLIFIVLSQLVLIPIRILPVNPQYTYGLAGRIQRIILYMVLFYIPLSIVSIQYVMRTSLESEDVRYLQQQIALVQNELQSLTPENLDLLRDTGYVNWSLATLSNKLYCDINFYDTQGWLRGSSRSAIFRKHLLGTRIHAIAWNRLQNQQASQFVQRECVGAMQYSSIYAPMFFQGQLLGYLNLPYFRSPKLEQQKYIHLASLILNVLLLFTFMKVFVMRQFTHFITRHLQRVRQALETFSFTKQGKPIRYNAKDEIGLLIDTYNRMMTESAQKASLLVASERESAWKEMARQIAHDIKNPLTPMKLGLQHLVLLKRNGSADWDERFLKYAQMLESQIDALSATADTFTTYATLTLGNAELTSLNEAIEHSLWLFRSYDTIHWKVDLQASEKVCVVIDPTNLRRVFNNLFSNAVHALATIPEPCLEVRTECNASVVRVWVIDNGIGIEPAISDKIFKVNFTTKSTGHGLGLAITSNILKSAGGDIYFDSVLGRGTCFTIELPIAQ